MKLSITNFLSQCDQIRSFLRVWAHLLKKSVLENLIFYAVISDKRFSVIGIVYILNDDLPAEISHL